MNHALHFAGFCVAFLTSTLLLSFTLLTASCLYKKYLMRAPQYDVRHTDTRTVPHLSNVVNYFVIESVF